MYDWASRWRCQQPSCSAFRVKALSLPLFLSLCAWRKNGVTCYLSPDISTQSGKRGNSHSQTGNELSAVSERMVREGKGQELSRVDNKLMRALPEVLRIVHCDVQHSAYSRLRKH